MKGSIHGSKIIPLTLEEDNSDVMEEGEIYALETFATTGTGLANPNYMSSHYSLNEMSEYPPM